MRHACKQGIVRILGRSLHAECPEFLGTGFIIGADLVLTCAHVLDGHDGFRLTYDDQELAARSVASFWPHDLAVLQTERALSAPVARFVSPLSAEQLLAASGQMQVHGFIDSGYTRACRRAVKNVWHSELGHHGQLDGGLPHGMSGWPLVRDADVLGMIYSGGADAGQTAFYAADELVTLLQERGFAPQLCAAPPPNHWRRRAQLALGLVTCTFAAWLWPVLSPSSPSPAAGRSQAVAAPSCSDPGPIKQADHMRIAIARFQHVGPAQSSLGPSVAEQLKVALDSLRDEQLFDELGADLAQQIEIVTLPCTLERHEEAEKVATAWHADLVLWGQAYDGAGSDPRLAFSVLPRATLHRPEASLHTSSPAPLPFSGISSMSWQQLSSNSPLQLVSLALGLHFLEQKKAWIAARFFVMFQQGKSLALDHGQAAALKALLGRALLEMPGEAAASIELTRAALADDPVASVAGRLLVNIGVGYNEEGKYADALAAFQEALHLFEQQSDVTSSARALNNIGASLSHQDKPSQALEYYERARALLTDGASDELASVLNNTGGAWDALGEHAKAIAYYQRTIDLLDRQDVKHPGLAGVLNNLGLSQMALGELDAAERSYDRALALDRERLTDTHPAVARDWANLGDLHEARGDRNLAESCYLAARDVLRRLNPDQPLLASTDVKSLRAHLQDRLGPRRCVSSIHNAPTQ